MSPLSFTTRKVYRSPYTQAHWQSVDIISTDTAAWLSTFLEPPVLNKNLTTCPSIPGKRSYPKHNLSFHDLWSPHAIIRSWLAPFLVSRLEQKSRRESRQPWKRNEIQLLNPHHTTPPLSQSDVWGEADWRCLAKSPINRSKNASVSPPFKTQKGSRWREKLSYGLSTFETYSSFSPGAVP